MIGYRNEIVQVVPPRCSNGSGGQDGVGGERVFGAAVAGNLRHAAPPVESAVIDGCGHYVSKERPDELAELLLRFFDQRPRP